MISRIDIEDMTDAQDEAPERIWADEAFWPNVTKGEADACWPWIGAKMGRGYGSIRPHKGGRSTGAHRFSWALSRGRWPRKGEVVMHTCDVPECVNPRHLRLGTQSENVRDCVAKGRHKPFIAPPKDACPNGHKYSAETTEYVLSRGRKTRRCAECHRENNRKWRARNAG